MVRVHQSHAFGDDPVTVKVGIIAKGDVKILFQRHQPGHGIWGGAVHPDFAVFVHMHKGKSRVKIVVKNLHIQTIPFFDGPVV